MACGRVRYLGRARNACHLQFIARATNMKRARPHARGVRLNHKRRLGNPPLQMNRFWVRRHVGMTRGGGIPGAANWRYGIGMIDCQAIRNRWEAVGSKLDERGRRVFAAGEVRAAGWGGLEAVSEITGLARSTIGRGLKDLDAGPLPKGRVRRKGAAGELCRTGTRR